VVLDEIAANARIKVGRIATSPAPEQSKSINDAYMAVGILIGYGRAISQMSPAEARRVRSQLRQLIGQIGSTRTQLSAGAVEPEGGAMVAAATGSDDDSGGGTPEDPVAS
jgi:hypothetical protein